MAWQSDEIQPFSSSPADDIFKIQNDLQVVKAILEGGTDPGVATTPLATKVYSDSAAGRYGVSLRNLFDNAAFRIFKYTDWTVFNSSADRLVVNRWRVGFRPSASGVVTPSLASISPIFDAGFKSALTLTVNTAEATISAGKSLYITQVLPYYIADSFYQKDFTLSFWVKSSKVGTYCVAIDQNNGTKLFVAEYTVNSANTWEKKVVTVSGGTQLVGAQNELGVRFIVAGQPSTAVTPGVWFTSDSTGVKRCTSNQVNAIDTVGATFSIAGAQIELGSAPTDFEIRPKWLDNDICKRFYYKFDVAPGGHFATGVAENNTFAVAILRLPFELSAFLYNQQTLGAAYLGVAAGAASDYIVATTADKTCTNLPDVSTFSTASNPTDTVKMQFTASGLLTTGQAAILKTGTGNGALSIRTE